MNFADSPSRSICMALVLVSEFVNLSAMNDVSILNNLDDLGEVEDQ